MKQLSLDHENNTWFFFPIYGLNIKRSKDWRNFAFINATIVNSDDLKEYLQTTECNKNIDHLRNPDKLKFEFLSDLSYLIVSVEKYLCDKTSKDVESIAIERAYQITSLLHLFFLFSSYFNYTINLKSEVYNSNCFHYCYINSRGRWGDTEKYTKGEHRISIPDKGYVYSMKQLKKQLFKTPFTNLSKMMVENVENKHTKIISNSLVYFYKMSNTPSAISQQLGSTTAIELLLKSSEQYKKIENRIKILLDEQTYDDFVKQIDKNEVNKNNHMGVFQKRHCIIHEASGCTENDAYRAICLYCSVLISYTKSCNRFYSNEEFNTYLDIIYKYKYDQNFKQDSLLLLKDYSKNIFDINSIDWVTRNVISYFDLCSTTKDEINQNDYLKAVYFIKKIRKIEVKEAYNRLKNNLYYYNPPYKNFDLFLVEYEQKIDGLITDGDFWKINSYIV